MVVAEEFDEKAVPMEASTIDRMKILFLMLMYSLYLIVLALLLDICET